ncbi:MULTISPECIES: ABC transporter ATP-binding protein [Streptosporangium]|uniref:ABC-type multidrug transport system ATPase subunit n=1 Tax=Streptosporangium brasiliense TaxID=47480 RepID=A0ABT9R1F1_9ACTN|nr:ABC transporter ATP-binding protein [Streptosporangium brasiliense]MDP9862624.1 ABC-type multidrug transport system ATPase subunit [Streptosporangium brasiliense]
MSPTIITVRDVGVELGGNPVLRTVGLTAAPGEIVAVIGANGAGKSTLLRCLAGLQPPGSGELDVLGGPPRDDSAFWRDVVLVGDEPAWYPGLTAREHLELVRAVHMPPRLEVDAALELFDLERRADASPLTLSTGQRQRLSLASALLRPSRLLLLDEPERGLDSAFRQRLAAILMDYAASGGTVVMATHDLGLAGATGARQAVLADGHLDDGRTAAGRATTPHPDNGRTGDERAADGRAGTGHGGEGTGHGGEGTGHGGGGHAAGRGTADGRAAGGA